LPSGAVVGKLYLYTSPGILGETTVRFAPLSEEYADAVKTCAGSYRCKYTPQGYYYAGKYEYWSEEGAKEKEYIYVKKGYKLVGSLTDGLIVKE